MSERINPRGNPAPQSDPGIESPSTTSVYAPPEYFARQRHPAEEKLLTTNAYAPPEYFAERNTPSQSDPGTESPSMMSAYAPPEYFAERNTEPQFDPWEERRMTEVYAPPELMRPAMDARQDPSAQRLYPQRYEENRPDPDPRVSDGEPCFAPVYAAPPIPGPDEPRTAPVYAAPPIPGPNEPRRTPVPAAPSKPKKGLFERLFGRRKKP